MLQGRQTLPIGATIGSYVVNDVLGAGGFGITYKCRDISNGVEVALKEYFPIDTAVRGQGSTIIQPAKQEAVDRFEKGKHDTLREADTLANFRHPNIVRIVKRFQANNTVYLALSFEAGAKLDRWREGLGRPPTQDEIDHIVKPLLEALHVLHRNAFLHRDIAPDNIIVRPKSGPVLLDLGAARQTQPDKVQITTILKRGFAPPEQYDRDASQQGPWTDIYAFAATIYFIVTDNFVEESVLRKIGSASYVPAASAAKSQYRPSFLYGLDQALLLDPKARPQSVRDWRRILYPDPVSPPATRVANYQGPTKIPLPPVGRQPPPRLGAPAPQGKTVITWLLDLLR